MCGFLKSELFVVAGFNITADCFLPWTNFVFSDVVRFFIGIMSAGGSSIERIIFQEYLAKMCVSDDLERCCGEYCGKNRVASFGILDILQFFENMIKIFFNAANGFNTDKCRLKERTKVLSGKKIRLFCGKICEKAFEG